MINAFCTKEIKNLSLDSRQVKPGDLFFALSGTECDGRTYIQDALLKGAEAVLVEASNLEYQDIINLNTISVKKTNRYIIPYPNLKHAIGYMAAIFYDNPSTKYPVLGITGTNGKTSCSHFIAQILAYVKKQCAMIGTLGAGFLEDWTPLNNTTPHAILVQQLLAKYYEKKADATVMEVTSVALDQSRAAGTQFHTVIFTNLTRDHLDYHGDVEAYWKAKKALFLNYVWKHAIINLEDPYGLALFDTLSQKVQTVSVPTPLMGYTTLPRHAIKKDPFQSSNNLITTETITFDENGIQAWIKTPWGEGQLQCQLYGRFNLSNVLASLAAACLQGIPFSEVLEGIRGLKTAPGRMLTLKKLENLPLVIIDYAHTPDALKQVLQAVRTHCKGKIWCVFGCGGDRDRGKRPLMSAIAEENSDNIVITSDNPRSETIQQIFTDMQKGLIRPDKVHFEMDRKKAIEIAIKHASSEDIIVIAGKGHETVQIIQSEHIPFSDEKVAREILKDLQRKY